MTKSTNNAGLLPRTLLIGALAATGLVAGATQAAVPGISGGAATAAAVSFNLDASPILVTMPDGAQVYTWAYGCGVAPAAPAPGAAPVASAPAGGFLPTNWVAAAAVGAVPAVPSSTSPSCGLGQLPGPTLIVTEGQVVTVNLYNGLPVAAGNTSIVFSSFPTTASGNAQPGLVTKEAASGTTVSYTFTASSPGTYAYYSGSRPELQVEMGLYGALVVLPKTPVSLTGCAVGNPSLRGLSGNTVGGTDYRLSTSAYDHAATCYDREYLFQFSEVNGDLHQAVLDCITAGCTQINVATDPYRANYFLLNGRAFPDDGDPNYTSLYPNQPYNGNPQMHPGEMTLLRVVGQGRTEHPFHIHANHGRVVARDGNLLLASTDATELAGPLYYTVPTVPGQAQDLLFTYTAKGLNWDIYGHNLNQNPPLPIGPTAAGNPSKDPYPCYADVNGYYSAKSSPAALVTAPNYYEWCADHNKPIPITPPDPQIVANGLWYGGTPYLGLTQIPLGGGAPQFLSTPLPPGTNIQNPTAGYAFMWHSHAERELTTNNVFPGGMLMMLIVQPPSVAIDETL